MWSYYTIKSKQTKKLEIAIKSKETSSYQLPTLQAALATYNLCLFMQKQFQLGSYIHACKNETRSLSNLQDLIPTLADNTNKPN